VGIDPSYHSIMERSAIWVIRGNASVIAIREAAWLNSGRVGAYTRVLAIAIIFAAVYRLVLGLDLAADYRSFWAASVLALEGHPAAAYDPVIHYNIETMIPGIWDAGWAAFFYPPIFLFVCLPLSLLPFSVSVVAWLTTTGAVFAASVSKLVPRSNWLTALAFPASWMNAGSGQNGFLTAGLLTFGIRWMDARPILAGVFFGCLAYKPQFATVLPFALVASGRTRVMLSAAVTVFVLAGASVMAFGTAAWAGFIHDLPLARLALETGAEKPWKLASVAGAALLVGMPTDAAFVLQVVSTVFACVFLMVFGRRCRDTLLLGSAMCICATLASPWVHNYDLTILALPIVCLVSEGLRTGFRPWERVTLFVAYALPLVNAPLAIGAHLPVVPFVLVGMLTLIWYRAAAVQR
jgi:alpha-1,2-mannosyltransferase